MNLILLNLYVFYHCLKSPRRGRNTCSNHIIKCVKFLLGDLLFLYTIYYIYISNTYTYFIYQEEGKDHFYIWIYQKWKIKGYEAAKFFPNNEFECQGMRQRNFLSYSCKSIFNSGMLDLGVGVNLRPSFKTEISSLDSLYDDKLIILGFTSLTVVVLPLFRDLKKNPKKHLN